MTTDDAEWIKWRGRPFTCATVNPRWRFSSSGLSMRCDHCFKGILLKEVKVQKCSNFFTLTPSLSCKCNNRKLWSPEWHNHHLLVSTAKISNIIRSNVISLTFWRVCLRTLKFSIADYWLVETPIDIFYQRNAGDVALHLECDGILYYYIACSWNAELHQLNANVFRIWSELDLHSSIDGN